MPERAARQLQNDPPVRWDIVTRLWLEHVCEHKTGLYAALGAAAVYALVQLSIPLAFKYIFDVIIAEEKSLAKYAFAMVILFGALLIRTGAAYLRTRLSAFVAFRTTADIRNSLFAHIQKLSFSYFDRGRTGDIMSRITNDVVTLQNFILNSLEDFFIAPVMVTGGLIILFILNWVLATVVLLSSIAVALLLRIFGGALRRVNDSIQKLHARMTGVLSESIATVRVVQSFGREEDQIRKFNEVSEDLGFIDLFHAAGDHAFFETHGMLLDGVHFTQAGGDYMGRLMFDAFWSDGASLTAGVGGDFNGDGLVNTQDINPFIAALGGTTPAPLYGDLVRDGAITTEDINPFVQTMVQSAAGVPEPATVLVVVWVGLLASPRRRTRQRRTRARRPYVNSAPSLRAGG